MRAIATASPATIAFASSLDTIATPPSLSPEVAPNTSYLINRPSPWTIQDVKKGQHIPQCTVLVHAELAGHDIFVELRCPVCGRNAGQSGHFKGFMGLSNHVLNAHPGSNGICTMSREVLVRIWTHHTWTMPQVYAMAIGKLPEPEIIKNEKRSAKDDIHGAPAAKRSNADPAKKIVEQLSEVVSDMSAKARSSNAIEIASNN